MKREVQKFIPQTPTRERFLPFTLSVPCERHNKPVHVACWTISGEGVHRYEAVCDDRARKAGLNGEINPRSLHIPTKKV